MNLQKKIFFFDYNHTLVNTASAHTKAMKAMATAMKNLGFEKSVASDIVGRVHYTTSLMIAGFLIQKEKEWDHVPGGKDAYMELSHKIRQYQKEVYKQWGFIKKWSREVFLKIAADQVGVRLNNKHIRHITDAYWDTITYAKPFPSARVLFRELQKRKVPSYVLTSSDGRLQHLRGRFVYKPEYSERLKRKRLSILRKFGLTFRDLIIGDPYDKPLEQYFEKGIRQVERNLGRSLSVKDFVMVGNSFEDDMEIPIRLGFHAGILIDEGKKLKVKDKLIVVGDLKEVVQLL